MRGELTELTMELENVEQMVAIFEQMPKTPQSSGALSRLYTTRKKLVRQIMMWYIVNAPSGYMAEVAKLIGEMKDA
ncbi:MAG TPA: hypothetical protein VMW58_07235 [Anaerolineae bacterium]|nr:hypothetical protein [Anaerolineae bacterium]